MSAAPTKRPAVRAARDGQLAGGCHVVGDQPLGGGVEVVEDVLLGVAHPRSVPVLSLFAAATQVDDDVDTTGFDPREDRGGVGGGERDAETAVAVEDRGSGAGGGVLTANHEHADGGAVLRWVDDLLGR